MKTWFAPLAVLIVSCGAAWADVPPGPSPRPRPFDNSVPVPPVRAPFPPTEFPFVVNGTGGPGELRLVLPAKLVQELQTAQNGSGGFQIPGPEQLPTLIAGLALSLAVVTGGLWLLRSRRRLAFGTLAFILATTTVLGIGCIHTKNKTTNDQQGPTPLVQTGDWKLTGQAVLASSDKDEVQVIVDREAMGRYIASSGIKTEIIDANNPPPAGERK
jgi:hypothetical protein